jgi:hypothetical protein
VRLRALHGDVVERVLGAPPFTGDLAVIAERDVQTQAANPHGGLVYGHGQVIGGVAALPVPFWSARRLLMCDVTGRSSRVYPARFRPNQPVIRSVSTCMAQGQAVLSLPRRPEAWLLHCRPVMAGTPA